MGLWSATRATSDPRSSKVRRPRPRRGTRYDPTCPRPSPVARRPRPVRPGPLLPARPETLHDPESTRVRTPPVVVREEGSGVCSKGTGPGSRPGGPVDDLRLPVTVDPGVVDAVASTEVSQDRQRGRTSLGHGKPVRHPRLVLGCMVWWSDFLDFGCDVGLPEPGLPVPGLLPSAETSGGPKGRPVGRGPLRLDPASRRCSLESPSVDFPGPLCPRGGYRGPPEYPWFCHPVRRRDPPVWVSVA